MAKHIGIVAVSAEGAALCYQTICREAGPLMGKHNHPMVSMHTIPLADYMVPIEAGDSDSLGVLLAESASSLDAAGAGFFICPDNTAHIAFDIAQAKTQKPWLHIADEVATVAKSRGMKKLGILGTRYLMNSDVYPGQLRRHGIAWEIPDVPDKERINNIIFDELVCGVIEDKSKAFFLGVVDTLRQRGCDAVVLGCTEIPLIVLPAESSLPTLDSTRILARAAIRFALE